MRLTDIDKLQLKLREYADKKAFNGEIEVANGILKAKCFIDQECTVIEERQLNNGWIPVSERLPGEHKRYLVSMKHKSLNDTFIDCRYCDPDHQFEYQNSLERHNWEVTAWQPLPEPYKEDKND